MTTKSTMKFLSEKILAYDIICDIICGLEVSGHG